MQAIYYFLLNMVLRSPLFTGITGFLGGLYFYDINPESAKSILMSISGWLTKMTSGLGGLM